MPKIVDARGKPCPEPVILTRQAMTEGEVVTTIVDNEIARRNVTRMAERAGWEARAEEREEGIYLHLTPKEAKVTPQAEAAPAEGPTVVLIPANAVGRGPEELAEILIRGFLHTLKELEPRPDRMLFINTGGKLVVEGSPVLEDLEALHDKGVEILVCGTCLKYFELVDQVAVGEVSNMYTIAEALLQAGRIVVV